MSYDISDCHRYINGISTDNNGTIKTVTVIMLKIAVSRMTLGQVVAAVAVEVAATAAAPPQRSIANSQ